MSQMQLARAKRALAKLDELDPLFRADVDDLEQFVTAGMALPRIKTAAKAILAADDVPFEDLEPAASNAVRGLAVAEALRGRPDAAAVAFLGGLLDIPSLWVRQAAIGALSAVGTSTAKKVLEQARAEATDLDFKAQLLAGLSRFDCPDIPEGLDELLWSDELEVQKAGLALAAKDPSPKVTDLLLAVSRTCPTPAAPEAPIRSCASARTRAWTRP
jgi:HEAT repeat protein